MKLNNLPSNQLDKQLCYQLKFSLQSQPFNNLNKLISPTRTFMWIQLENQLLKKFLKR